MDGIDIEHVESLISFLIICILFSYIATAPLRASTAAIPTRQIHSSQPIAAAAIGMYRILFILSTKL